MRQRGFVLPIVLIVAALAALILAFALQMQKRRNDVDTEDQRRQDFRLLASRMKQILDTVSLCTCNVRNLTRNAQGVVEIDPSNSVNLRSYFGFFKLASVAGKTECDPAVKFADPDKDILLEVTQGTPSYKSSRATDRVTINGFQDMNETRVDPATGQTVHRYKANFSFAARDKVGLENQIFKSRSSQNNPIDLDVFLELVQDRILGCYLPYAKSASSPSPSPSPLPSSSTSEVQLVTFCGVDVPMDWGGTDNFWECNGQFAPGSLFTSGCGCASGAGTGHTCGTVGQTDSCSGAGIIGIGPLGGGTSTLNCICRDHETAKNQLRRIPNQWNCPAGSSKVGQACSTPTFFPDGEGCYCRAYYWDCGFSGATCPQQAKSCPTYQATSTCAMDNGFGTIVNMTCTCKY